MSIHPLRSPVLPDTTTRVRDGERRHIEKLMKQAARDGEISVEEQDQIMRGFGASPTVVRDVYLATAARLAKGSNAPAGLDALIDRLESRDADLDQATRWGNELALASVDGSISASDRQVLVGMFSGLPKQSQTAVLAALRYYNVAGASDLLVELEFAAKNPPPIRHSGRHP